VLSSQLKGRKARSLWQPRHSQPAGTYQQHWETLAWWIKIDRQVNERGGGGRGRRTKTSTSSKPAIKYKTVPQCITPAQSYIQGSLRCYDGDDNENVKKAVGWIRQNNNFTRASRSFVHFFAVTAQLRLEWPNLTFYRQLEHTTTNFSFSF